MHVPATGYIVSCVGPSHAPNPVAHTAACCGGCVRTRRHGHGVHFTVGRDHACADRNVHELGFADSKSHPQLHLINLNG